MYIYIYFVHAITLFFTVTILSHLSRHNMTNKHSTQKLTHTQFEEGYNWRTR